METSPSFALVTKPSFALTVFRVVTRGLGADALNDLNRAFYARVSARGEIFLTQTQLNGVFCVRLAVGAERTRREHIDRAWALICEEAEGAVKEWAEKVKSAAE